MTNQLRAELFLLRKSRAAMWIGLIWVTISVIFGLVIPLIVHAAIGGKPTASVPDPSALLAGLRPMNVVATTTGLYPIYGAAFMLILGAVVIGADFRHHTWGTVFVQDPRRITIVAAKLGAVSLAAVVITVVDLLVMTAASLVIAGFVGLPRDLPAASTVLWGGAACALTAVMAVCLGAMAAVLSRGIAVAVAVGLVWMLAVENLMASLAGASPVFAHIRAIFPGGGAGSLMSQFSGTTDKLPGVAHLESVGMALVVIIAYLVVSAGLSVIVIRRRDEL